MRVLCCVTSIVSVVYISLVSSDESCPRMEKVGCFSDTFKTKAERVFPKELVNRRDRNSKNFDGTLIRWKAFQESVEGLACACARAAKAKGWQYFGLQFFGECWSGDTLNPGRDGTSKNCIGSNFKPCIDSDERKCIGEQLTNYVYALKEAPTKKCERACPLIYDPVCDNKGQTHENACLFSIAKCKDSTLKVAYKGECKDDIPCFNPVVPSDESCPDIGHWKLEKVGCFHDSFKTKADRVFPNELINRRDGKSNNNDGQIINWKAYPDSITSLACACAKATITKGWKYFGLQFFGECWSGKTLKPGRDGPSKKCIGTNYKPCINNSKTQCIGKARTNYVYKLTWDIPCFNPVVPSDESCPDLRHWRLEKVGCFHDSFITKADRVFPNELINRRDPNNNNYDGHQINWKAYPDSIKSLACACAKATITKGWKYFGLQFYGECWSGKTLMPGRDGPSNKCIGTNYKPCTDNSKRYCIGKARTNYVYKLTSGERVL